MKLLGLNSVCRAWAATSGKHGRHAVEFELLQTADDLRAHGWTPLTADGTTDWRKLS